MIEAQKNIVLQSLHSRFFLVDIFYKKNKQPKPVIIFCHGFKGFKDWGPYNVLAEKIANEDFVFVKFNFSHNGTTVEHPVDFVDLEAFGNDNITKELDDLKIVIDWVCSKDFPLGEEEKDLSNIYLIGHSRGGGIAILKAREDARIKKLCTWASLNEFAKYWTQQQLDTIKRDGVIYIANARTNQQMPIKWQMYEDYYKNKERLFVPDAVRQLKIPFLIIHGTKDETVPVECAVEMQQWNDKAELELIENANHNFGGRHPGSGEELSDYTKQLLSATIEFFKGQ